jgi:hypothetical protein
MDLQAKGQDESTAVVAKVKFLFVTYTALKLKAFCNSLLKIAHVLYHGVYGYSLAIFAFSFPVMRGEVRRTCKERRRQKRKRTKRTRIRARRESARCLSYPRAKDATQ